MLFLVLGIFIVLVVLFFYLVNYLTILEKVKRENTDNIIVEDNIIEFDSLTLSQKIAQMIIVKGEKKKNTYLTNLGIGGIYLFNQKTEENYSSLVSEYQDVSKINLFVSVDLEGVWNPFSNFQEFPKFSEITTKGEAHNVGLEHGKILKRVGFNLNFAPVAEFSDNVYGGRAFTGTEEEIKDKLESYIKGLQKNVLGTCKHYPGKGMIRNLHYMKDRQEISKKDLELFDVCFENNISAIMIGHQIVSGELNSNGKPSSVSKEVIGNLGNFSGLIISDEINMVGLKRFYLLSKKRLYRDLINSGENLILDFRLTPVSAYKLLDKLEKLVGNGRIDEDKIDQSVKKILMAKGYKIE
jgi:beta-N-acetylhexosaminidase